MPDPFLDADSSTTASTSNNNNTRYRRRRLAGKPLISQADLISSSSSSTQPIANGHGSNTPPPTAADGYSNKKNNNRKKNFTTASFRSLGCTASSQVSVPASIRSSANWEAKKMRKRNQRRDNPTLATTTTTIDDVWCVPAIALSATTDTAASFDRLKLDADKRKKTAKKMNLRKERSSSSSSSSSTRRMMNQEAVTFEGFGIPHHGLDEFRHRSFHHHVRRSPSPEGLSEIVMIQDRRPTGVRIGGLDRYQEWRLNVDDMSYEELLELGEKIGNVNTGLKEEEMVQCLRKIKISGGGQEEEDPTTQSSHYNCSICQEEYGEKDETGELDCGHFFHTHCIEQWLLRKNSCPICKTAAIAE